MAKEIERKFALRVEDWKKLAVKTNKHYIQQGYLFIRDGFHVRVRISAMGATTTCTLTTKVGKGISREEYEHEISLDHAKALMSQCDDRVFTKIRIHDVHEGMKWDLDYFPHLVMAVAEIEIPDENYPIEKPPYVGREVTGQGKYSNIKIALQNEDR